MQTIDPSPLVAERQRRTWTAIHDAAASLTLEDGVDGVTVARIAEAAGVSPRTFFNYFDSKEDAIVGVRSPQLTDAALATFAEPSGATALMRVARLVTDVAATTQGPGVDHVRRRQLAATYPALRSRLVQVFTESRKLVVERLIDTADPVWAGAAGLPTDRREARALVLLAGAVVTLAWTTDTDRLLSDRDATLVDAIATFRKVCQASL